MKNELSPEELEALAQERAKIFSRQWFADLLGGKLGFGDTYWLGNFGVMLFAVPAVVLLAGLAYAQSQPLLVGLMRLCAGIFGLWLLAVLRALWRVKARIGALDGWGWTGLIWTAGSAVGALLTAAMLSA